MMSVEGISISILAVVLITAYLDARLAKIQNAAIFILLALFIAKAVFFPETVDAVWQIVIAALVFAAGFALFTLGAIGAGAVKFGAAIMLFMPMASWGWLLGIFIGTLLIYTFLFIFLQTSFGGDESKWASLRRRIVPMSWPIGTMAIFGLFVL